MPFEPLPKEDQEAWNRSVCTHPEHNPPTMMVITYPMVWVCPACGERTAIYPNKVWM